MNSGLPTHLSPCQELYHGLRFAETLISSYIMHLDLSKIFSACQQLSHVLRSVKTLVFLTAALSNTQVCQNICLPVSSSLIHSGLSKHLSPCQQLSHPLRSVKTFLSLSATLSSTQVCQNICLPVSSSFLHLILQNPYIPITSSLMYSGLSSNLPPCQQLSHALRSVTIFVSL